MVTILLILFGLTLWTLIGFMSVFAKMFNSKPRTAVDVVVQLPVSLIANIACKLEELNAARKRNR